jgi:hypothetical protein
LYSSRSTTNNFRDPSQSFAAGSIFLAAEPNQPKKKRKKERKKDMGPRKIDYEAVQRITKALGPDVS